MEMYSEIDVVFLPANSTSILQLRNQVTFWFSSLIIQEIHFLRLCFHIYDSSDRDGQNKLQTFWKGFTILDAIKNILWDEIKISMLKKFGRSWFQPLEGFKTSLEEVAADVVEIAWVLELEVQPEDVTVLQQSHDNLFTDEELLLIDEQRKCFLRWYLTLVKMLWRLLKWQWKI